jgi:hypothetical protein
MEGHVMTVLPFPTPEGGPRLRLVKTESEREMSDFQLDQLIEAAEAFAVVISEATGASRRLMCGDKLLDSDAALCGETLHSALLGLKPLIELAGMSNDNRELYHLIEARIKAYEGGDHAG